MDITVGKEGEKILVTIRGKVDEAGADQLKDSFFSILQGKGSQVELNFQDTTHIGSSGIGNILLFYKNMAINDSKLSIINLSPVLFELFQELKLDTLFSISRRS